MLKRIVFIFSLLVLVTIPSKAGLFGGGGGGGSLKEILKLLKSIDAATGANGTATIAEIESKVELIQQTKMQLEQLRMEVENFKTLGKDLKDLDIRKINNIIDRTLGFKDYAGMTADQMAKNLDSFFSDYEGNRYKLLDKIDLDVLKRQRQKLKENKEEMQKAVYNNMAKNQMYANIKDQGEDLKRKVATLDSVAGTLQAIQAVGGILEQTNQILLEMKQMMATNSELKDRLEAEEKREEQIKNDNLEAEEKNNEKIQERLKRKYEEDRKKTKVKIKF